MFTCFVVSSAGLAWAQRATLGGQVRDSSGAFLPHVRIIALNLDQGLKRETLTDVHGAFTVPLLQPGRYVVQAEKDGFATAEVTGMVLHVGDTRALDLVLPLRTVRVTVVVHDESATVERVSPALSYVVTGENLRQAPLLSRDVLDLALLQPGVLPINPDAGGANNFSITGNRNDSVTFLLDGVVNNDLLDNGVVYDPNPDVVAEFRILTSTYTADYGRNAGGVISLITRSGTNHFHGSVFDYLRNDALNANSYFNRAAGLPRDVLKRNQFGGAFGGPLLLPHVHSRDRFFYFVGYQGHRQRDTETSRTTTFTPDELRGNFSDLSRGGKENPVAMFLENHPAYQPNPDLAAGGVIAPSAINGVARNYIAQGLIPTAPDGTLASQQAGSFNRDELTVKFDVEASSRNKFTLTTGGDRSRELSPFAFANVPGFPSAVEFHDGFADLAFYRTITANLLNEARVGAHRVDVLNNQPALRLPNPNDLGIQINSDNPSGPTSLTFASGLNIGFSFNGPSRIADNTYSWSDTLTWIHGRHQWKFGAGGAAFQSNPHFDFFVNGQFFFSNHSDQSQTGSGNDLADFLLGLPTDFTQGPSAVSNIRTHFTNAFVSDEWHVRPNLVLTLGLRYEYSTPKTDTEGRLFSIIPGRRSTIFPGAPVGMLFPGDAGAPVGTNFPDGNNFAPRLGFAWDPTGRGNTSLRASVGVFYDILKAEDSLQFNGQPPFYPLTGLVFQPFPTGPDAAASMALMHPYLAANTRDPFPSRFPDHNLDFDAAGFLPINSSGAVFVTDPHLTTPFNYQFNLNLQHQLTGSSILELAYVGSSSHGLTALTDANPFVLGTTTRVLNNTPGNSDSSFASLPEFRNVVRAHFNSLQVNWRKQMSAVRWWGSSYFNLAYTYAHNIDNASGFQNRNSAVPFYDPERFRAASDFDLRHRVVLSGGWDLPLARLTPSAPRPLTRGWSVFPIISWRSGFPLDIFANLPSAVDPTSQGPSGAGDANLVRANVIGPIRYLDPRHSQTFVGNTGNFWFDPASFSNAFPSDDDVLANPALRTYGSLPRNFLRGPGRFNVNLAVAKKTALGSEARELEFRADFFNLLNQAQFSNPVTDPEDSFFGQIISTASPRILQLALRFSF